MQRSSSLPSILIQSRSGSVPTTNTPTMSNTPSLAVTNDVTRDVNHELERLSISTSISHLHLTDKTVSFQDMPKLADPEMPPDLKAYFRNVKANAALRVRKAAKISHLQRVLTEDLIPRWSVNLEQNPYQQPELNDKLLFADQQRNVAKDRIRLLISMYERHVTSSSKNEEVNWKILEEFSKGNGGATLIADLREHVLKLEAKESSNVESVLEKRYTKLKDEPVTSDLLFKTATSAITTSQRARSRSRSRSRSRERRTDSSSSSYPYRGRGRGRGNPRARGRGRGFHGSNSRGRGNHGGNHGGNYGNHGGNHGSHGGNYGNHGNNLHERHSNGGIELTGLNSDETALIMSWREKTRSK